MIKNYLTIAWRNLTRHKAFSILNIAGLAIGMASSILILLWVQDEMSYDRFHANAGRIYRLVCNSGDFKAAVSPAGMGAGLKSALPEIKDVVRLSKPANTLVEVGNRSFEEKRFFYADANFLQVFSFPLVSGNTSTAMQGSSSILLTQDMAKKYFGTEDAVGKIMRINNKDNFTVSGVLANPPGNSHLQFDFIMPMSVIAGTNYDLKTNTWGSFNFYTYLLLQPNSNKTGAGINKLTQQIQQLFINHGEKAPIDFHLQAITSIHLHSGLQIDLPGQGNIQYVNIFFVVALFILAVACINFMNLATARSARRAKEVGLRKVVGAGRTQIIFQFLGESMLIAFISLAIALGIVALLLPAFNQLADKKLVIQLLNGKMFIGLLSIALVTGLVSGSYPALFLSGFKPVKVLKGKSSLGGANLRFRNTLVVLQFVVSIILLAGTTVVYRQLQYIKDKDLGFEKSNLLYLPMAGDIWNKQQALKAMLQDNPLTKEFTVISDLPTELETGTLDIHWEGKDPNKNVVIPTLAVDENFTRVFKATMLAGRSFTSEFKTDSASVVINEKMLSLMGLSASQAIGKTIRFGNSPASSIIGVVKDFNVKSLQYTIDPMVLVFNRYGGITMVRTQSGKTEATIKAMAAVYKTLNPAYPFNYNFLDKDLDNLYRGEQKMGSIFNLFAVLAIFISCLGLYGLSAFMAEQRTKEIGVRKVLGASVFNIVYLLSGSFTRLIVIAMAIAIPISWFAINNWLKGFAYRIDINWIIFFIAAVTALAVAWLTVSYESVKAAIANPVKSLRTE